MQQDLFYQLFLEECLNSFTRLKNLGAWLRGHPLLLPCRQKHDFPKQRQGPFHPTNSLTTAASFLLAFDMLHFVPMTELQSRRGGWRLVSLTLWSVAALLTWNFHHLILWTSEGVASSQTWFTFSFAFCVSKCATASVCFLVQSHGEETTRSRCGLLCVISFNLKWLGWNLSFGFEEFFSFGWTFWNLWGYHQKNEKFSAALSLRKPIFTHPVLDQWPCHHNHTRLDLCLDSDSALAPHPRKNKRKTPKLASPLQVFVSSAVGANLPSWLCFSQHVVARLDSSRYFSASWSLPLLRRGRRARLSSAKLRLEVSSISLSNWSSWNCEGKEKQLVLN